MMENSRRGSGDAGDFRDAVAERRKGSTTGVYREISASDSIFFIDLLSAQKCA